MGGWRALQRALLAGLMLGGLYTTGTRAQERIPVDGSMEQQTPDSILKQYVVDSAGFAGKQFPLQLSVYVIPDLDLPGTTDMFVTTDGTEPSGDLSNWVVYPDPETNGERLLLYLDNNATTVRVAIRSRSGPNYGNGPVTTFTIGSSTHPLSWWPIEQPSGELTKSLEKVWAHSLEVPMPIVGKFFKVSFNLDTRKNSDAIKGTHDLELRVATTKETAMNVMSGKRTGYNPPEEEYLNSFNKDTFIIRSKVGTATANGNGNPNYIYLWGGRTLQMSLTSLQGRDQDSAFSDTSTATNYTLQVTQEEVTPGNGMKCLSDGMTNNINEEEMNGGEWSFFAMDLPEEGYLRVQLTGGERVQEDDSIKGMNNNMDMFLSTVEPFPTGKSESFYSKEGCGKDKCLETIPVPTDLGEMKEPDPCGQSKRQLYVGIHSNANPMDEFTRYRLSVISLGKRCGWRPSGKVCNTHNADIVRYGDPLGSCQLCDGKELGGVDYCAASVTDTIAMLPGNCNPIQSSADSDYDKCDNYANACECAASSECGWCGRDTENGQCVPKNMAYPTFPRMGHCPYFWSKEHPEIEGVGCADTCQVHMLAPHGDVCSSCLSDPHCGMCLGEVGLGCVNVAMNGTEKAPAAGSCSATWLGPLPENNNLPVQLMQRPLFPFFGDLNLCVRIAELGEANLLVADREYEGVLDKLAPACGFGICDRKYYKYELPKSVLSKRKKHRRALLEEHSDTDLNKAFDVQVSVTFEDPEVNVSHVHVMGFKAKPEELAKKAAATFEGKRLMPDSGNYGALTYNALGVTTVTMLLSVCDINIVDSFFFGVYNTPQDLVIDRNPTLESVRTGNRKSADALQSKLQGIKYRLTMKVLPTTFEVDATQEEPTMLPDQFTCCGNDRHLRLAVKTTEALKGHVHQYKFQMLPTSMSNVVNESQFSQFVVPRNVGTYAQVGACAGSSPDSHSRDVATALPASNWAVVEDMQAEGVDLNWFTAVSAGLAFVNFTAKLSYADLGPPRTNSVEEDDTKLAAVAAALGFAIFIGATCITFYAWKRRQMCFAVPTKKEADALLSERAVDSNGLTPIEGTLPGDFLERQGFFSSGGRTSALSTPPEGPRTSFKRTASKQKIIIDRVVTMAREIPDMEKLLQDIITASDEVGLKNVAVSMKGPGGIPMPPAPPPPPGGKLLKIPTKRSKMTAYGEMEHNPDVISEFQKMRSDLGLRDELRSKDKEVEMGKGVEVKTEMLDELRGRSSHFLAVQEETEKYRGMLMQLSDEIKQYKPKSMEKLSRFLPKVEMALDALSDERAVLKNIGTWPERRMDTLREANALHLELQGLLVSLASLDKVSDQFSDADTLGFYEESQKIFDRVSTRLDQIKTLYDNQVKKFQEENLPWDKPLLENCVHTALKFYQTFGIRALRDITTLRSEPEFTLDMEERQKFILDMSVKLGFRVHQFSGGFTKACSLVFNKLANLRTEVVQTSKLASQPTTPIGSQKNTPRESPTEPPPLPPDMTSRF